MNLLRCPRDRERRSGIISPILILIVTVALLSSCARPTDETKGSRDTVHLSSLAWNLLMATPRTESDDQRLAAAVNLSVKRCMAKEGFAYFPTKIDESPTPYRVSLPEYPASYNLRSRKVNGYGLGGLFYRQ